MARERELAVELAATLSQAGHRALFAGGCVRDLLLGDAPHDFDIATSARPEEVMRIFAKTAAVGASFGVVLVLPDGKTPFDVATFRRDLGYSDLRRPDAIEFTDEREDARRRDFSINGLFMDPATGEILDYVGGRADLEEGVVRAIGDPHERIAEDRLRMLRAIRFAARYQFSLDRATFAAIRKHASSVVHVSPERIRDELVKMLTRGDAAVALELLDASGLLPVLLPEVAALKDMPLQVGAFTGAWERTLLMLSDLHAPSPTLALATLLSQVRWAAQGEDDAEQRRARENVGVEPVLARFRLSNRDADRVHSVLRDLRVVAELPTWRLSEQKRFLRRDHVSELLELYRLDCIAAGVGLASFAHSLNLVETTPPHELRPKPLLGGEELIRLGLKPGPEFRRILHDLETAQLDGEIRTREAAVACVQAHHLAD